jgi:3D (Asp-Asp-Asp) domain-containing protein
MVNRALAALVVSIAFMSAAVTAQQKPRPKAGGRLQMIATAYCDGGKTDGGPVARPGMVAADPRILPLGSVITIEAPTRSQYNGTYTVMDTGSAIKGHKVDIFIPNCAEAKQFGERRVVARVVQRAAPKKGDAGESR